MIKTKIILEKYFYQLMGIILIIRTTYIFYFPNRSGDYGFYERLAKGIIKGCGYAVQSNEGECIPIVGHYMPGFHYLMSIFYYFGYDAKLFLVFISLLHLLATYYLFKIIKKFYKNTYLAKKVFVILTISPLTLGFNRLLLMEPVLTVLSIIFLAFTIKIYFEGFRKSNSFLVITFLIMAIYIKPTGIFFIIPFIVLGFYKLGLRQLLIKLIISLIIISISILPWGLRNLSLGASNPYTSFMESSFFPKNSTGYLNWLSTWIITEYEQANNAFIVWRQPFDMKLKKNKLNPFISAKELAKVQEKYTSPVKFKESDDIFFNELAKNRRNDLGLIGNTSLHSMKILSLMLNPLNSWGWPLEISNYRYQLSKSKTDMVNLNFNLIFKLFIKFILFIYRLFLFFTFFRLIFNSFLFRKNKIYSEYTNLNYIISRSAIILLFSILYLISVKYPSLEHRFLSIAIPWIETTCFLSLSNKNKKLINF